jgi:hypothetical protein
MAVTYKLDQWAVVVRADPYKAPELLRQSLSGICKGHPDFPDDHFVTTSHIRGKTVDNKVVTSSGSHIELLDVNPQYAAQYFNPRERLLGSLPLIEDFA